MEYVVGIIVISLIVVFFSNKKRNQLIDTYFDTIYIGSFKNILDFINDRVDTKIKSKSDLESLRKYVLKLQDEGKLIALPNDYWVRKDIYSEIENHLRNNSVISMNDVSNYIATDKFRILLSNELMQALAQMNLVENLAPDLWRSNLAVTDNLEKELIVL